MSWSRDLRGSVRTLRRAPGFTLLSLTTLAIGIGATTAIFSVLHDVLLRALPYPEHGQIVGVHTRFVDEGRSIPRLTGPDLEDLRARARSLDAFSYYYGGELGVQLGDHAEFTGVQFVTADFFRVFRPVPIAGSLPGADATGAAVVGKRFAERNYGSAASAVSDELSVEGRTYTIAGVLDTAFAFPPAAEVWVSAPALPPNQNRTAFNYRAVARVATGIPIDAATAEVEGIGDALALTHPDTNATRSFALLELRDQLSGPVSASLWMLMGAATLVLLIACVNVANLLLARATVRGREIAVRAALGASRAQIVRRLLLESALIGVAGGLLGIGLARATLRLLLVQLPAEFQRAAGVRIDAEALLFAFGASFTCVLVFGLAPAWRTSRVDIRSALASGDGARGLLGGQTARTRETLVVAEVALAVLLATGAGLLLRSLVELGKAPLGYQPERLLVMKAHSPAAELEDYVSVARLFSETEETLGALPGVRSVGAAMGLPTGAYGSNGAYAVEGLHEFGPGAKLPQANFSLASPGYFETLGIPLLEGRAFAPRDLYDAPFVAIISESLALKTFPGKDPLGQRLQCGLDSLEFMTIVGVVGDVRQDSPATPPEPTLYMPLAQHPYFANEVQVVLRTEVPPGSLVTPVRDQIRRQHPDVAVRFTTLERMIDTSIAAPRLRARLAALFAGVALLLAGAGIYGVMAFSVAQRRGEMALRIALGARATDVAGLVARGALAMASTGLALGLGAALAVTRVMRSMVFGVDPVDATTWWGVAVVVAAITLMAGGVPAWRAGRADPAAVLRDD